MLNQAKIAVLVSGSGTNLQALLDASKQGVLVSGEIALVISDKKGALALDRARKAGVPHVALDRRELGQAAVEKGILRLLAAHRIDLVILAGFLLILSADFLSACQLPVINVHPSLLPAFGGKGWYGLKVHQGVLDRGVQVTGATVHLVTPGADEGPILSQKAVKVYKNDTPERLQQRVMKQAEWVILPRAAEALCKTILKEKQRAKA